MKKHLTTILFLLLSNTAQRLTMNKGLYADVARLKIDLFYLKVIKTFRLLFINSLGIGICLIFLLSSLVLFHVTFFLYAPFTVESKMWLGFAFAAFYLFIALKSFSYIFGENRWIGLFHAEHMLKKAEGMVSPQRNSKPTSERNG